MSRVTVTYHVASDASSIEARARAIAVEQSVEMPVEAIVQEDVKAAIVGEVQGIRELGYRHYEVRIGLARETLGEDAGQLTNMLFGNVSLQSDVSLADVDFPAEMETFYGGPNYGLDGIRKLCRADHRPMTCTALKPQGLSPAQLAELSEALAQGGLDFIKDDHGIANQSYSPFQKRVAACAAAVARADARAHVKTSYVPSVSGPYETARKQIIFALEEGIAAVLVCPMILGLANFHALVREFPDMMFFAHPALGGAARIAPPFLFGKLFRMLGADVVIYPNYGGRFQYTNDTCGAIADAARVPRGKLKPAVPAPAGGMTLDRVPELLDFYGRDTMLLIGGSLLSARERLTEAATEFSSVVAGYFERAGHGANKPHS
jgi:ribulose-bisphosphate carboxylase large chain